MKKITNLLLVLIVAVGFILSAIACADEPEGLWADATYLEDTELGEGARTFTVEVIAEDTSVTFTVHTDKETVGEALVACGLIEGTEGAYGLYIDKVNGILASWDENQSYWAFSIGGEYAMSGVDTTAITDGAHYELTYTK